MVALATPTTPVVSASKLVILVATTEPESDAVTASLSSRPVMVPASLASNAACAWAMVPVNVVIPAFKVT